MLSDARILRRSGGCEVIADEQRVEWPDGTAVALHPVRMNGHNDMYRRALVLPGGLCLVVDLRRLCPPLRDDLMQLQERDHPGAIKHNLRLNFGTAADAVTRVVNSADMSITPASRIGGGLVDQAVAA